MQVCVARSNWLYQPQDFAGVNGHRAYTRSMAHEHPAASKDFLRSIALFGGLEDASLERIQTVLVQHLFARDAVVCTEGERGRSMYVVAGGEVEVRRTNSGGGQIPIVRLGPGEFFGEMTLIEIQPRAATVVVTEPATLYSMTNRDLYALYLEDHNAYVLVLQNICRQLARRLRLADVRIAELLGAASEHSSSARL